MKSFLLTGILISLFSATLLAQPTITSQSNPEPGQAWDVVILDGSNFDPGPTGPNQNWDYSNVPVGMGFPPFQFSIIDPANAPFTDSFPGATHVVKWDLLGFPFHQYEYADNQKRVTLGGVVPEDSSFLTMTQYIDDDDAVQYPLSYQKSYTFSSRQRLTVAGFTFYYTAEGKVDIDAYGSLTLPTGTYNDVLRMRIERVQIDSSFATPERDTTIQYAWLQEGNGIGLLVYEYSLNPDNGDPSLYYAAPAMTSSLTAALKNEQFSVYHLPGTRNIQLSFEDISPTQALDIQLLDASGKMVQQLHKGTLPSSEINLPFLPKSPGLYIVMISDVKGRTVSRKLIH